MVILGIDLGTKNICVATPKIHSFGIVLNREAKRTNEGILGFTEQEGRLYGSIAKSQQKRNIRNTLYELIRLIGRKWSDEDLLNDSIWWGFKLVKHPSSSETIAVEVTHNNQTYILGPEQILAAYISHLRDLAISDLKTKDVRDCCVAVPNYFSHQQRQMVANACLIARMNLLNIVNSTTAVALMWGLNPMDDGVKSQFVMFVDIGYANTQVGVAQYTTEKNTMHMICQTSQRNAGGRDIDRAMVRYFVSQINKKYKTDILNGVNPNWKIINRLLQACDKLKKKLGLNNEASILIDCLIKGDDYVLQLNRDQLQELVEPILSRMLVPIKAALSKLKTRLAVKSNMAKFYCVELVGGGLRVPLIRQRIELLIEHAKKEIQHMENCIVRKTLNGDECVSKGTAYLATMLSKSYRVREADFYDMANFDIHVVSEADPKNAIDVEAPMIPLAQIVTRPIWRRGSKIPSTRILKLDPKQTELLIRTPNSPNSFLLISQNEGESLKFGAETWLCKIYIAWEQIANHKYSEILTEHLRTEQESPIILMARIGSGDLLGRFEAYCPILLSVLEAFDRKKKGEEDALKTPEEKTSGAEKKDAQKIDIDEQESSASPNQKMDTNDDNEKTKKKDKKKNENKMKKIALTVTAEFFVKNMTPINQAREVEMAMKKLDDDIANIQNTRNFLETLIYEVRDKLEAQYIPVIDPKHLEGHKRTISEMIEKLEDEEEISNNVNKYTQDIDLIKSMTKPLEVLIEEHRTRPHAVAVLTEWIKKYLLTAEKAEYMDGEKKKKVIEKCNTMQEWLQQLVSMQEKQPLWCKVVVTVALLQQKLHELNACCRPLCKQPTPPPPPPVEDKSDKKVSNKDKMETDEATNTSSKDTTNMDVESEAGGTSTA